MGCIPSKSDHQSNQSHQAALYHALPSKYESHKVIKVYDGDTLTLEDKRRVRFLGIDCPELQEKQPFAQEAKDYVADKCRNKDVYFSFEPGGEKTDRYGRLLAWVWVGQGTGYLNINEALVSEGLANVYSPNPKKLQNSSKLIALQKKARESRVGKWRSYKDVQVYRTKNGKAFHKQNCKHLARSTNLQKISASKGTDQGLYPCRACLSDM